MVLVSLYASTADAANNLIAFFKNKATKFKRWVILTISQFPSNFDSKFSVQFSIRMGYFFAPYFLVLLLLLLGECTNKMDFFRFKLDICYILTKQNFCVWPTICHWVPDFLLSFIANAKMFKHFSRCWFCVGLAVGINVCHFTSTISPIWLGNVQFQFFLTYVV